MKRTLIIAAAVVLTSVLSIFLFGLAKYDIDVHLTESRVWQHGNSSASPDTGSDSLPAGLSIDGSFESHLPLIVIDTGSEALTGTGHGDSNPYVSAVFTVYDSGSVNSLSDEGERLTGRIKLRGGESDGCKFQYRLKFLDTFGDNVKYPLLGMTSADEWILDGCASDKSCLRNYLAYNLAAEIGLNSPDVRYCEVFMKQEVGYEYMGLYLAVEPVEQGKGRVSFKGKRSLVGAWSYIVKRDGEDSSRPLLETWAYENAIDVTIGKEDRCLTLVYPKNAKATEAAISYVTENISSVERILYSNHVLSEAALRDNIDIDSFVDYYLLNEFTMNRDAGKRSTFMYRDIGGNLTMGPVWGFNDCAGEGQEFSSVMNTMPWFDRLVMNDEFCRLLERRWTSLRTGYLSDERISSEIAETTAFLGNALLRDNCRRSICCGETITSAKSASNLESRLLAHAEYLDDNLLEFSSKESGGILGVGE